MCEKLGASLASMSDVNDALSKGAEWCGYGWTKEGHQVYPMGDHYSTCEGKSGLVEAENIKKTKAGAICIGEKPPLNSEGVYAFKPGYWFMDDFLNS